MKQLPLEFKGRGSQKAFIFTQIKREKDVVLYKKQSESAVYFETMIIKSHNGMTIGGVFMEPAEFLPGDNQFGLAGWCYVNQEKAEQKYQQLLNRKTDANQP